MKKIIGLYLLLISPSIFSMQPANKLQQKLSQRVDTQSVVCGAYLLNQSAYYGNIVQFPTTVPMRLLGGAAAIGIGLLTNKIVVQKQDKNQ